MPQFMKMITHIEYISNECDSYKIFCYLTRYTLTFTAGLKFYKK